MKTKLIAILPAALLITGCSGTHDKGSYLPQLSKTPAYESTEPVVLLDPGVQYSVTTTGQPLARLLDDAVAGGIADRTIPEHQGEQERALKRFAQCYEKGI